MRALYFIATKAKPAGDIKYYHVCNTLKEMEEAKLSQLDVNINVTRLRSNTIEKDPTLDYSRNKQIYTVHSKYKQAAKTIITMPTIKKTPQKQYSALQNGRNSSPLKNQRIDRHHRTASNIQNLSPHIPPLHDQEFHIERYLTSHPSFLRCQKPAD